MLSDIYIAIACLFDKNNRFLHKSILKIRHICYLPWVCHFLHPSGRQQNEGHIIRQHFSHKWKISRSSILVESKNLFFFRKVACPSLTQALVPGKKNIPRYYSIVSIFFNRNKWLYSLNRNKDFSFYWTVIFPWPNIAS